MDELNQLTFEDACELVNLGTFEANDQEKLRLYGYFKVATNQCEILSNEKSSIILKAKKEALQQAKAECSGIEDAKNKYKNLVRHLIENSLK